jgi:head-tail adaptor
VASVAHLMNRTLTVRREVTASDGYGGQTVAYSLVGDVPARVSRPSASEREVAAREGVEITHEVYLNPEADVRRGDQLVDGDQVLEVVSVVEPSRVDYRKATCREEVPS